MQIGQTIWASLDFITSKDEKYLSEGKEYEVTDIDLLNNSFSILSDTNEDIYFFMDKFSEFFSLTPPKEVKEGVSEIGWIAVSEQLPFFGETVLVYCSIYGKFLATYEFIGDFQGEKYGNWRDFNGNLGILPPVYWLRIPETPNKLSSQS